MGTRLLALFQFTECLYRATLLVNIHIAIVKDTEIQPGDNSQSISAISLGLHLKALSQIAEMIHCTWLYIIMAVVIVYYLFFFFIFCWHACGGDADFCSMLSLHLPSLCAAEPLQLCCILGLPLSSPWISQHLPNTET